LDTCLAQIQTPAFQQQVYRATHAITRSQGIDPQEAALLKTLAETFHLSPEMIQALIRQPLVTSPSDRAMNSPLMGITAFIGRDAEVGQLIFDYALGAAIAGLIPITGPPLAPYSA